MKTRAYVGVEPAGPPGCWTLDVTKERCSGHGSLFGGIGLAAATIAAEVDSGRSLVWATAQFVGLARPGELVELEVNLLAEGKSSTQSRIICHVGDREILSVFASLGAREFAEEGVWVEPPVVPPPEQCPPKVPMGGGGWALADLDQRVALGGVDHDPVNPVPDGRSAVWFRPPAELEVDTGFLAIVGDFVPYGTRRALITPVTSTSLDNTIRVVNPVPTEWVLADIRVTSVANGYTQGVVHLWADDGTLMATASQTAGLRVLQR